MMWCIHTVGSTTLRSGLNVFIIYFQTRLWHYKPTVYKLWLYKSRSVSSDFFLCFSRVMAHPFWPLNLPFFVSLQVWSIWWRSWVCCWNCWRMRAWVQPRRRRWAWSGTWSNSCSRLVSVTSRFRTAGETSCLQPCWNNSDINNYNTVNERIISNTTDVHSIKIE